MPLNARQRQQKIEKRNRKRKQNRKSISASPALGRCAARYARFPIHECLIPSGLFETGIGSAIVSRRTPDGDIAVSAFVVDVFCLGVKNALFTTVNEIDYERKVKRRLAESHSGQYFERAHAACVKKIIEGAVGYADGFGFNPHADYRNAKGILDEVDAIACPVKYTYGKNGKPFYVQGPYESPWQSKKIVESLRMKCGEGGYDYVVSVGQHVFEQDIPRVV
jgi:hypothetical protein